MDWVVIDGDPEHHVESSKIYLPPGGDITEYTEQVRTSLV